MNKEIISSDKAPAAIGPYSQAIKLDNLLFSSGQVAFIPGTKQLVQDTIAEETRQVLTNLQNLVEEAGSSLRHALKITIFMTDMNNYSIINKVYAEFFGESKPARSAVSVSKLPAGANIEIEGIFYIPK